MRKEDCGLWKNDPEEQRKPRVPLKTSVSQEASFQVSTVGVMYRPVHEALGFSGK